MEETVWVTPHFNMSQAMYWTLAVSVLLVILATAAVWQLYKLMQDNRQVRDYTIEFPAQKAEEEFTREELLFQLLILLEQRKDTPSELLEITAGEVIL